MLYYATKIRMKSGCGNSWNLTEIDSIYLEGQGKAGFYTKESIHDFLNVYPGTIKVNRKPFPDVIPAVSVYREKFVKSIPNEFMDDNLLCLPRV